MVQLQALIVCLFLGWFGGKGKVDQHAKMLHGTNGIFKPTFHRNLCMVNVYINIPGPWSMWDMLRSAKGIYTDMG